MAVSTPLPHYARKLLAAGAAAGFTSVTIHDDPMSMKKIITGTLPSGSTATLTVSDELFAITAQVKPEMIIDKLLRVPINRYNELDLTQNAIEGLEDIRALLDRAEHDMRRVDTIILTRQQIDDINSGIIASTIFGKNVIVK